MCSMDIYGMSDFFEQIACEAQSHPTGEASIDLVILPEARVLK